MTEYAPQPIRDLFNSIKARIPQAVLSGILGDTAHTDGYHRARAVLSPGDYSCVLGKDLQGDIWAASALDISLPPDLMITVTNRLLNAAKAGDTRLAAVREFCGTTNGTQTHNYDIFYRNEGIDQWDDSHLWHIHLSFYRAYANNITALLPIVDVLAGAGESTSGGGIPIISEEPLKLDADDQKFIINAIDSRIQGLLGGTISRIVDMPASVATAVITRPLAGAIGYNGNVAQAIGALLKDASAPEPTPPTAAEIADAVLANAGPGIAQEVVDLITQKLGA